MGSQKRVGAGQILVVLPCKSAVHTLERAPHHKKHETSFIRVAGLRNWLPYLKERPPTAGSATAAETQSEMYRGREKKEFGVCASLMTLVTGMVIHWSSQ